MGFSNTTIFLKPDKSHCLDEYSLVLLCHQGLICQGETSVTVAPSFIAEGNAKVARSSLINYYHI
jgi:hypothetical protein